jgi:N,N'-diacetyllegionaminate synthase
MLRTFTSEGFALDGRQIGGGAPCFIIAEAGVNHDGSIETAARLVDAAVAAGADAVKLQTFDAEALASATAPKAGYQQRTTGAGESQLAMLRRLQLAPDDFAALKRQCETRGILFLSTPFDDASADLLERLGVAAFKLPSGELTNLPFLSRVASKGRPLIVSTGMADLGEVEAAVDAISGAGSPPFALLHCTSAYPADPADANLRAMDVMRAAFGVPVGFSDHTAGIEVALAAVARGAAIVEKHLTLDRSAPGPDHASSLEPGAFGAMVRGIRIVESALGDGRKRRRPAEADVAAAARRSVVAARDLPAGTVLDGAAVVMLRPGTGLPPSVLPDLLGRRLRRAVARGEALSWDQLD